MQNTIAKDTLREEPLSYFDDASSVEVYQKGHSFIKDEFADLVEWAMGDDVQFLLQNTGVLICVPSDTQLKTSL